MDLEQLKSDYNKVNIKNSIAREDLLKMKHSRNHPVLKSIKKQLLFESIIWILVLIVYYDFFDGQQKSIFWNSLLIMSILLLVIHNILGYLLVKKSVFRNSIKEHLQEYLVKLKTFSYISIGTRVCAVTIFLGFLTSKATWELNKTLLFIALFLITIGTQIYFLRNVWNRRIQHIENALRTF